MNPNDRNRRKSSKRNDLGDERNRDEKLGPGGGEPGERQGRGQGESQRSDDIGPGRAEDDRNGEDEDNV